MRKAQLGLKFVYLVMFIDLKTEVSLIICRDLFYVDYQVCTGVLMWIRRDLVQALPDNGYIQTFKDLI